MWNELVKHLADYDSAIVTGFDDSGYPFSFRCKPEPDTAAQALRVRVPEYAHIRPGSAGLLCHKHDEWLWNLESFIVRGCLEPTAQGWLFRPLRFTPGADVGGLAMLKFVQAGRRTTQQYLDKRGLARPRIAWQEIQAMWAETRKVKPRRKPLSLTASR